MITLIRIVIMTNPIIPNEEELMLASAESLLPCEDSIIKALLIVRIHVPTKNKNKKKPSLFKKRNRKWREPPPN